MKNRYSHWFAALASDDKSPVYRRLVNLIAADIDSGLYQPQERLPTLRDMAARLSLNYSTVARAYSEARSRGLIDSSPGTGSYVKGKTPSFSLRGGGDVEMTMNSLPEPADPALLEALNAEAAALFDGGNLQTLLRYQDFGGSEADKLAGVQLLAPLLEQPSVERVLVCPGIHSVLVALLSMLAKAGDTVCVPDLVYPGLKAIAAQLGVSLKALECDSEGPTIRSLEAMCRAESVAALYLNPTLQNPTTHTMSMRRREAIADLARRYSLPIIEDDAYALVPEVPVAPIANLVPELTYYVTGLSKCFGPGMRVAYLHTPGKLIAKRTAGALRSLSVMASPLNNALATRWIDKGMLAAMVTSIRAESRARQALAAQYFSDYSYAAHPDGFHLWLTLPGAVEQSPSVVASHLRTQKVGVVSSAAFSTNNRPPPAVRLCLGGTTTRYQYEESLKLVVDILEHPSHLSSISF
ncbi:MAG: PLP-dependent aminotransferase family protein [Gammaproteobacteria bacterium]|nr:PLP-dependent aminotransferase family protein [Gammaproteobacteria bacterium]